MNYYEINDSQKMVWHLHEIEDRLMNMQGEYDTNFSELDDDVCKILDIVRVPSLVALGQLILLALILWRVW